MTRENRSFTWRKGHVASERASPHSKCRASHYRGIPAGCQYIYLEVAMQGLVEEDGRDEREVRPLEKDADCQNHRNGTVSTGFSRE
jgi:hypothetical protein